MKYKGIVLYSIDYKESSKIVYLYTNKGLKSVKAIGGLKQNKGLLSFITTGNVVDVIDNDNKFPTLVEYRTLYSINGYDLSLKKMDRVAIMLSVLKSIPDDSNHERYFDFVESIYKSLISYDEDKAISLFLIKSTYMFGVSVNLNECYICKGKPSLLSYKGLSYCNRCKSINDEGLYNIWKEYYYDKKDYKDYSSYDYNKLIKILEEFYKNNVYIELKHLI